MSATTEHMLTNIALWVSSKKTPDLIIHGPTVNDTRVIYVNDNNYLNVRRYIDKYFEDVGNIENIIYNHEEDNYTILVNGVKYTIAYLQNFIVKL